MSSPRDLRSNHDLTIKDLAVVTGANPRTVKKWDASPTIDIQERFVTRLDGLDAVLQELAGFSTSFKHAWLRQPKTALDGLSPREALAADRWDDVHRLARLTAAGAPPLTPSNDEHLDEPPRIKERV
jgi:hypothetical protein